MYGKDNNLGRKGGDERRDLYFYVTSLYINIYLFQKYLVSKRSFNKDICKAFVGQIYICFEC